MTSKIYQIKNILWYPIGTISKPFSISLFNKMRKIPCLSIFFLSLKFLQRKFQIGLSDGGIILVRYHKFFQRRSKRHSNSSQKISRSVCFQENISLIYSNSTSNLIWHGFWKLNLSSNPSKLTKTQSYSPCGRNVV